MRKGGSKAERDVSLMVVDYLCNGGVDEFETVRVVGGSGLVAQQEEQSHGQDEQENHNDSDYHYSETQARMRACCFR